jgi:hypothetical protein
LVSQSLLKGQSFIKVKHFCCFGFAVNWWGAYGGLAFELMSLAKKVSLCCSASGCERNWSTFSQVSYSYPISK